ncbi:DUF1287 domain-containing protein [Clostridium polynesiense]|uniref:DUF1287 domain-containing protein n=1 Tax=Clostridium polynesiense TaxID=1325933 RepID=UPI00058E8682|nr:DUF1287 domain-containing protein [Clostridium polynesiense]
MKKFISISFILIAFLIAITVFLPGKRYIKEGISLVKRESENLFKNDLKVPEEYSKADKNKNGIPDPLDMVQAARREVENETVYVSNYYVGGYPPDSEGVCTDVIWRAFAGMEINLKELMDEDIKKNIKLYPRVNGSPDPNIDFRRVPNQEVFFKRHAQSLPTEVKAWDIENLKQWQPGDIILFLEPYQHVGVISDKRDKDGIPYLIHNSTPHAKEVKLSWITDSTPLTGHYRWKY